MSKNHESGWLNRFEVGEFFLDLGFFKTIFGWKSKHEGWTVCPKLQFSKKEKDIRSLQNELILSETPIILAEPAHADRHPDELGGGGVRIARLELERAEAKNLYQHDPNQDFWVIFF